MAEVAMLGAGRMGAAMCRRLVGAGHTVRLWNRTPDKARALQHELGTDRVAVLTLASDAVVGADVVLAMLADGDATLAVLADPGLMSRLAEASVVCDLGTSGVEAARRLTTVYTEAGHHYLDAPVSGSVSTVAAGALLVMASGDPAAVRAAEPVLAAFAHQVIRVGPHGHGQAMKLAVNLVVHDLSSAVSEALVLATRAGVDAATAYDVLENSAVAAPFVLYKRAAFLGADVPVAMSLDLVAKDLRLITDLALDLGVEVPVSTATHEVVDAAVAEGYGARDMADLRAFLDAR